MSEPEARPDGVPAISPRRRVSIGLMMLVVLFVAVDIALWRAFWKSSPANIVLIVTLPTINLLAFSLLRPNQEPDSRPAWIGFQVVGWAMVVLFGACTYFAFETFLAPVIWVESRIVDGIWSLRSLALIIGGTVVGYTIPQVGAAWAVGSFLKRYRVVIERRRPVAARPEVEANQNGLPKMKPRRRVSIGLMMLIVLFVAVDIAAVKAAYWNLMVRETNISPGYIEMIMPMVNVLLITFPRTRSAQDHHWFWRGFQAIGWTGIFILGYHDQYDREVLYYPYTKIEPYTGAISATGVENVVQAIATILVIYVPLQLLLAWLGGQAASWVSRHRIVILEHRS
jgi:NADH:ubiquinone oxidoreductase subunit 3 (subunit A)